MNTMVHQAEVGNRERFEFGKNWQAYLPGFDEKKLASTIESIKDALGTGKLDGYTFLDIGSGSGVFSLSASRLGANVTSFDFDPDSVACARLAKQRFAPESDWKIVEGSVLDKDFLESLGKFDVVYSWGVLHHTGRMWEALRNAADLVKPAGKLVIAIYNDQGRATKMWLWTKKAYNRLPQPLRFLILWPCALRLWGPRSILDLLMGRPFRTWRQYARDRGMSPWRDLVDWVGGLPFEAAKPEEIFDFYSKEGFQLKKIKTCAGGIGCNEYTFQAPATRVFPNTKRSG